MANRILISTVVLLSMLVCCPDGLAADAGFRTAAVTRGNVVETVEATGTVEPRDVLDITAQVPGRVVRLGPDPRGKTEPEYKDKTVDYGSPVEEGQLLAQIDDSEYANELESARIALARAEAELQREQAKLAMATQAKQHAADDQSRALQAAQEAVARSEVAVAETGLAKQKLALKQASQNLAKTQILSPVRGVIIDRRVNLGQTVVASFTVSSLFLIARDLDHLQVWLTVYESGIGRIKPGLSATFTCDAYPGQSFTARVSNVRLNAAQSHGSVTYTVVLETADDAKGKLLPYLTANATLEVSRRENVLRVPNQALRWNPQAAWVAEGSRDLFAKKGPRVWVEDGKSVRPVRVIPGLTDGIFTEILYGELADQTRVIVGGSPDSSERSDASGANPAVLRQALVRGWNTIEIDSGFISSNGVRVSGAPALAAADAPKIAANIPNVLCAAPILRARVTVSTSKRAWNPMFVLGTTPDLLSVWRWEIEAGSEFTNADLANRNKVCLLGQTVARELFAGAPPVGQTVRIGRDSFRVVGVMSSHTEPRLWADRDDVVLAPWTTLPPPQDPTNPSPPKTSTDPSSTPKPDDRQSNFDLPPVEQIVARVTHSDQSAQAVEQIEQLLRTLHHTRDTDLPGFWISDWNDQIRRDLAAESKRLPADL